MHISTMARAMVVPPDFMTIARAVKGSWTPLAGPGLLMAPSIETPFFGVTSAVAAPARNSNVRFFSTACD